MGLKVEDISLAYGKNIVVRDLSFRVQEKEIVSLLGHNGAGKTTILKGIIGLLKPKAGSIKFFSNEIGGLSPSENILRGLFYLASQNANFPDLSITTNLELAASTVESHGTIKRRMDEMFELFPILKSRSHQMAKRLSGGEKKMLEIGMALMTHPKLLLVDEPSLGLSPLMVDKVMQLMLEIRTRYGTSVLLVEQNVTQALAISQRTILIKIGKIILDESSENLKKLGKELFRYF